MFGVLFLCIFSGSLVALADSCSCSDSVTDSKNLAVVAELMNKVVGIGELNRVSEIRGNEFPFVGRFRSGGEYPTGCTGSILKGNQIVLTAGHCTDALGKNPLFILRLIKDFFPIVFREVACLAAP